jgi:hypothetical protein
MQLPTGVTSTAFASLRGQPFFALPPMLQRIADTWFCAVLAVILRFTIAEAAASELADFSSAAHEGLHICEIDAEPCYDNMTPCVDF